MSLLSLDKSYQNAKSAMSAFLGVLDDWNHEKTDKSVKEGCYG